MKRFTHIILTILLLSILSGCTAIKNLMISFDPASEFSYKGWKTVKLADYGTIKIPEDWVLTEQDGYYFIKKPGSTTDSYEVVLFQSKAYTTESCDINPLGQKVHFYESISANGLSNGPVYGEGRYSIDGVETTRWYVIISSLHKLDLLFLAEDSSIDGEMMRKIAASVAQGRKHST